MEEHAPVDLLVTDIAMPDVNGCELARRMIARHPSLRVLFMSGCAPGECSLSDIPGCSLLKKPFHIFDLRDRVRSLLAL